MTPMYSSPSFNHCQPMASFVLPIPPTPFYFEANSSYHFIHKYFSKNIFCNLNKILSSIAAIQCSKHLSHAYCLEGRHYTVVIIKMGEIGTLLNKLTLSWARGKIGQVFRNLVFLDGNKCC